MRWNEGAKRTRNPRRPPREQLAQLAERDQVAAAISACCIVRGQDVCPGESGCCSCSGATGLERLGQVWAWHRCGAILGVQGIVIHSRAATEDIIRPQHWHWHTQQQLPLSNDTLQLVLTSDPPERSDFPVSVQRLPIKVEKRRHDVIDAVFLQNNE